MDGLNPPQREAVQTLSGPLLVLAGAGTGKTRVVTYRIAELIRTGIKAERILAVTFTNKASTEMQERAAALLKRPKSATRPEISTFHSLCVRILRRHITRLGYPEKFAIYDRGDQEGLARSALRQIRVPGEVLRPGDLLWLISSWKSSGVRPEQAANEACTDKEHLAAHAYRIYQRDLKLAGAVDFDDLLLLTEEIYRKFPAVRREDARRYDHLLVDEYQDTNGTQYEIVKALAMGHRNLCVVGDDDQAIYGWRGAEVAHILSFQKDWPHAKVVRLEANYRSTSAIIEFSNRLIRFNSTRHDKRLIAARHGGERPRILQFEDEEKEAVEVVKDIQRELTRPGIEPRDVAVLFRTNEQPRVFEMELRRADIPYTLIGGMSFYDRKEVRDVLAYLKFIANQDDEVSLLRILNTPPRGIGKSTVGALMEHAVTQGESLWQCLCKVENSGVVPNAAVGAIVKFLNLIGHLAETAEKSSLVELGNELLSSISYREEINRLYPQEQDQLARWASIEELINAMANHQRRKKKKASLRGFLSDMILAEQDDADDKESQLARNAVALMTLHAAKGLEFPICYMVGMEEGILPHKRSLESNDAAVDEERRLCYVGVTRAQDRLTLSLALNRMKWGKKRETMPSRFLFEMTGKSEEASDASRVPKPKSRGKRAKRQSS